MSKQTPLVLKLGGVILDTPGALESLFNAISDFWSEQIRASQSKRPIVIVHGGGCVVDELMSKLNLPVAKIDGLRVTPRSQIDIVVGALAGSANKILMGKAKQANLKAIGLCLGDGDSVLVSPISEALGHVGRATAGDPEFLELLLSKGYLPIISSIGITENGERMNVNADEAAVAVAKCLSGELALLADVSGVLDANKTLIPKMDRALADELIHAKVITDGMVVKVNAALDAATNLGAPVAIASFKAFDELPKLFSGHSIGTLMLNTQ
ncbi:acetylglutamate kinase [Thorsellia anophelis]|uniref:Acetylglutamate kinase n=1 Tax=Thorsellia anophelis DSM 18579 TaxID=1123402 RepID=A0A1H9Z8J4_9GAMM|nr:acetylglutamate kinase [Thorsellia anophelis]SES77825.1 N-acetylglutamate kinase [Thorsellia anophelis DSM 18579]